MAFHALIRTHHITSRKKVAKLRKAGHSLACYVLLRSGGCPGIMYCAGPEHGVREWVATVQAGFPWLSPMRSVTVRETDCLQRLRYKDFQLVSKPAQVMPDADAALSASPDDSPDFCEVASTNEFANAMKQRGILLWWQRAMSFS